MRRSGREKQCGSQNQTADGFRSVHRGHETNPLLHRFLSLYAPHSSANLSFTVRRSRTSPGLGKNLVQTRLTPWVSRPAQWGFNTNGRRKASGLYREAIALNSPASRSARWVIEAKRAYAEGVAQGANTTKKSIALLKCGG
jgi:hypothetical protein